MKILQKYKNQILSTSLLLTMLILSIFVNKNDQIISHEINAADTAWTITATALVLLMTPGLAFFYGGMVSKKNVLSTMMQSFVCMSLVTILWMIVGFSLCFGDSIFGIFGNPTQYFMMSGVLQSAPWSLAPTIPFLAFALFQLKFAVITPALITGAFAGRVRFLPYLLFVALFSLLIYAPLAHATWHPDGILLKLGVLDFAGGTVVHMSAGIAALTCAIYLKRRDVLDTSPARISYVLIGTGLLWFGWIGFNGGSAFAANTLAVMALSTTAAASASSAFTWIFLEIFKARKPTSLGLSIGAVVGLVAITPAAGFVSIPHAIAIGIISSMVSFFMVEWRTRSNIDDTLDVFPCHGVGGIVGMILTGVFADKNINTTISVNGLFFGENKLFLTQLAATLVVSVFIFVATWLLLEFVNKISPLRASLEEEQIGLDITQHGERL